jgi:hypothetical protein
MDLKQLEPRYRTAFFDRGIDLIETDIPAQLGPLLYEKSSIPATKSKYFHY